MIISLSIQLDLGFKNKRYQLKYQQYVNNIVDSIIVKRKGSTIPKFKIELKTSSAKIDIETKHI